MTRPDTITELRLKLVANGYEVIPNLDKRTFMAGWPKLAQSEEEIGKWSRRYSRYTATGIRLANGLAVIDIDVVEKDVIGKIAIAFEDLFQEWGIDIDQVPIRGTTASCKEAWFVRTEEPFGRIHTYRWREPGAGPDDPTAHVEIFGGKGARQFGAFGPHSVDEREQVVSTYDWGDGPSPETMPLVALPELSKKQFFELVNAAGRILEQAGYESVKLSKSGEDAAHRVYDLTQDMQFDCDDRVTRSLAELRDAVGPGVGKLRCSASWLEGPEARRKDRCLVFVGRSGGVEIWETSSGVTHCEASRAPRDYGPDIQKKLLELAQAEQGSARTHT